MADCGAFVALSGQSRHLRSDRTIELATEFGISARQRLNTLSGVVHEAVRSPNGTRANH
jgi:hypothetical protein